MSRLFRYYLAVVFMMGEFCWAQIDIYQSPAYSVEEVCARQAQQNADKDYSEAYESCVTKNRDKPIEPGNRNPDENASDKTMEAPSNP